MTRITQTRILKSNKAIKPIKVKKIKQPKNKEPEPLKISEADYQVDISSHQALQE
jgi:hypothetical protein